MKSVLIALSLLIVSTAYAEVVVPVRTIRAREIIRYEDLVATSAEVRGAIATSAEIVGKEARVVLYAGRPILPGDVAPLALISRNDMVTLVFSKGPLRIVAEGRALGRGAVGETVRVMNMASRMIVTGKIVANGSIEVQ